VSVILHNRQRAFDEATVTSENYSRTLEENLLGFIRRVDMALLTVANEVSRQKANGGIKDKELEAFLARQDSYIPEARGLRVMDVQGNIQYAVSGVNTRGANIGDRPYFIRVRDDPNAGLVFSEPLMGRASNVWVITLSRRINNPDGSFAGEVNVAIATDRFTKIFSLLDFGPKGSASLWSNTQLIARYSKNAPNGAKTGTAVPSTQLRNLIDSAERTNSYHITTTLDGIERIYRFRKVGDYPLYLVVGLADGDFLSDWRKDSIRLAAFATIFVVGTLIFSWLLHRSWKQREYSELLLRETKERLEAAASAGIVGVWDWDVVNNRLVWDKVMYRLYGIREEDFGGAYEAWASAIHPEDKAYTEVEIQAALRGEREYAPEFRVIWPDASIHYIKVVSHTIYDEQGKALRMIGVNYDLTEQKHIEEALKTLNETLEQRVKEEVAKNMAQEKLLIQQSRLAAMGEMIGNIAHQWRQPISALTLLLANIKDANDYHELDSAMIDKSVAEGQEMIQKMSSTIDDFRNFFKPNKTRQNFQPWNSIEEAIKLVSESYKVNGIEIAMDKNSDSYEVIGYPNEFSQVVLNTLSNAKEAIVEKKIPGKVRIHIQKARDSATISIRDNGGGIPEDILPKIFDPYFTTKEKGTGIGLYMSQRIMEHMDGDITLRNVEDGVEVLLTLPLLSNIPVRLREGVADTT
jgi:PAS domain S-box-containing protein